MWALSACAVAVTVTVDRCWSSQSQFILWRTCPGCHELHGTCGRSLSKAEVVFQGVPSVSLDLPSP